MARSAIKLMVGYSTLGGVYFSVAPRGEFRNAVTYLPPADTASAVCQAGRNDSH